MKIAKYREFTKQHPWFPSAVRPLIDWQGQGPGEENPDRATELFFERQVSHLGCIPSSKCDLERLGAEADVLFLKSKLLSTRIKVHILRTFRIVYHEEGETRFGCSHSIASCSISIAKSIERYSKISNRVRVTDAVIEQVHIVYGDIKTNRFNVSIFDT